MGRLLHCLSRYALRSQVQVFTKLFLGAVLQRVADTRKEVGKFLTQSAKNVSGCIPHDVMFLQTLWETALWVTQESPSLYEVTERLNSLDVPSAWNSQVRKHDCLQIINKKTYETDLELRQWLGQDGAVENWQARSEEDIELRSPMEFENIKSSDGTDEAEYSDEDCAVISDEDLFDAVRSCRTF